MNYFSIAPEILYHDLDWLDHQIMLRDITHPVIEKKHIEVLKEVTLNQENVFAAPLTIQTQTKEFGLRMKEVHHYISQMKRNTSQMSSRAVHVLVKDFYFIKNHILIRNDEQVFGLYEMNRANERYLFGDEYFDSIDWSNSIQIPDTQNSLIVASAGSPNWGHFLIDELPRISLYLRELPVTEEVNIYFTSYSHYSGVFNKNRGEVIKLLFPKHELHFHFLDREKISHFQKANFLSPTTFHPIYKNRELTRLPRTLREATSNFTPRRSNRKLFCLRRSGARSIPQSDISNLMRIFEPWGFHFYYPEDHSVEHQIRIFSEADFIIGVMGAGMCDSIFTPSGATVLYIAPEGWEETFFWNLANQLGHGYHAYYCKTNAESDIPEINTLSLDLEDFYAYYLKLKTFAKELISP